MYELLNDYVKTKHGGNSKLCYMDTDRYRFYIKSDNIYQKISKDVEKSLTL